MKKAMNHQLLELPKNTYRISIIFFIVLFISAISSPAIFAQGMGGGMGGMGGGMGGMGGGMGGMGGGMGGGGMGRGRGNSNAQQPADTTPPVIKHQNPFGLDAAPAEGLEARTAALENFIFGSPQKKLPMKTRVERLEKRLVPYEHHKSSDDLNERIDHLWSMLASANKPSEKAPAQ